jgi:exonuclease SbcD
MFRLLHIADVHLDAPLGGFGQAAADRRAEVLEAFRGLSDLAVQVSAHAVLIAGDLFDGPRPSEKTIIAVRETVRRIADAGIAVFAVPGNHDARALAPTLYPEALDGAVCFLAPRFEEPALLETEAGSVCVYGVAYDAAEEPDPLATFRRSGGDADAHVVLLHGSVPGAPHWGGGSSLALPNDSLRALGVDYLALGDLHRFRGPSELDGIAACYPGSFAAVDLTESGRHGPVLVELTPGESPRLELRSSGVREVGAPVIVDVSACVTDVEVFDAVVAAVVADVVPSVELVGEPTYPLDPEAVRAMLIERSGAAALRDRSRFFDPSRLEELAGENTVAGHVARLGLDAIEEAGDDAARGAIEQGLRIALRVLEV